MNVSKIRESRKKLDGDLQRLQTRIAILQQEETRLQRTKESVLKKQD